MKFPLHLCICLGLLLGSVSAAAETVGRVTAQSTRMAPSTLTQRFRLKPGDLFTPALYDKSQDDLHKLRVFKTLDFTETHREGQVDIHIRAEDGYYLFPLFFIAGGSKTAGGASVAAGNLFKQGESTFLFAGGSEDGFATRAGLQLGDHFLTASYSHLNFDQRFYQHGWTNLYGIFSTTDDEETPKPTAAHRARAARPDGAFVFLPFDAYFARVYFSAVQTHYV